MNPYLLLDEILICELEKSMCHKLYFAEHSI